MDLHSLSDDRESPPPPSSAYVALENGACASSDLTRGPWHPDHQHAGPPIALVARGIERAAAALGLTHIARLTANLLRPIPIAELIVEVQTDYAGRNVAHFSARLIAGGKEVARVTAVAQREAALDIPPGLPGHPLPQAPRSVEESPPARFPFSTTMTGYQDLIESRIAEGVFFRGPSAVWFRLRYPLVAGEEPSALQRVAVAADSGNGISGILDFQRYIFVNSDLTINLLRKAEGEWICIDARTLLGPNGGGLAEARIFDEQGLIGRSTQSLAIRLRE
jgi:Thioesterase-like superfamily